MGVPGFFSVPGCSDMFRCSGVPCSGVPGNTTCPLEQSFELSFSFHVHYFPWSFIF